MSEFQKNLRANIFEIVQDTIRAELDIFNSKVDGMSGILSRLDVRLNKPVPCLFLLLPAEIKNG